MSTENVEVVDAERAGDRTDEELVQLLTKTLRAQVVAQLSVEIADEIRRGNLAPLRLSMCLMPLRDAALLSAMIVVRLKKYGTEEDLVRYIGALASL